MKGVREAFASMQVKYNRIEDILDCIWADEAIDIMLNAGAQSTPALTTANNTISSSSSAVAQSMNTCSQVQNVAADNRGGATSGAPASDILRSVTQSIRHQAPPGPRVVLLGTGI